MWVIGLDSYSNLPYMKKFFLLSFAAVLVLACSQKPGKTTRVTGQFTRNIPENVRLMSGEALDTTVAVVDGRFEADLPTDLLSVVVADAGLAPVLFVADGSAITIDPDAGTAVSDNQAGVQARFADFERWDREFSSAYRARMAEIGDDEEAAAAYYEEAIGQYEEHIKAVIRENGDNILSLIGLSKLDLDDPDEVIALLDGLSDQVKQTPDIVRLRASFETKVKTAEGTPFVDFTVVQDPENPEASTVRLSDYVGRGKYMLVDFWASWCGPCKAEMPNLAEIYNTYHGDDFDMLSIAVWDKPEDTLEAAPGLGIVWNQIINAQHIPTDLYGIEGIPHIILFGPDGTILKRDLRGEKIGAAVREALGR